MSNLRIIGIIIGCIGLYLSFRKYRGPDWNRGGFVLLSGTSISILSVSINPNVINVLVEILAMHEVQRGRIITVIIGSVMALFILFIFNRNTVSKLNYQLDHLIRKVSAENSANVIGNLKPIMVLIPAYNEADNLKVLLEKIPKLIAGKPVGVLVVDDGSSDETYNVAIEKGCFAVKNIINRGQGAASRLGYDLLCNKKVEIVVTMDADNQHRPEDIESLVAPINEGNADFVMGSRILGNHSGNDFVRTIGIHILTRIINFVTGARLTDCSSGFKAFKVRKIHTMNLMEDQFQSSEVIIEAAKNGLKITEVPITIVDRTHGNSKKGTNFVYGLNFLKVIIKTWWRKA